MERHEISKDNLNRYLMQSRGNYWVFHFEVNISAPRLDHGSKSQQILTLARARSIWDFQPLGVKARAMSVDFSDALDVKPVR
jgi:hypothetical protein